MLSTAQARSAARSARLAAARDYASEVTQHVELQDNLCLEDKILGSLSSIVMEAIDCVRADQPFRSSSLSLLSLELLSYLRQPNKPMLVNFACAFTMLMSELEGVDLTERGAETGGGPRSYSNSIPDVPPEATVVERASAVPFNAPSTSRQPLAKPPPPPPAAPVFPHNQDPRDTYPFKDVVPFKEEDISPAQERLSVEPIDYEEPDYGRHSMDGGDGMMEDGRSESSYADDTGGQNDLLQQMIANFSVPSTSSDNSFIRSDAARNQPKSKTGRFESRDDQLAATYALPVTAHEIETMPEVEMSQLMRSDQLSEMQRSVIRQIRKRARSKISSREYRKRKEAKRREEAMSSSHEPTDQ